MPIRFEYPILHLYWLVFFKIINQRNALASFCFVYHYSWNTPWRWCVFLPDVTSLGWWLSHGDNVPFPVSCEFSTMVVWCCMWFFQERPELLVQQIRHGMKLLGCPECAASPGLFLMMRRMRPQVRPEAILRILPWPGQHSWRIAFWRRRRKSASDARFAGIRLRCVILACFEELFADRKAGLCQVFVLIHLFDVTSIVMYMLGHATATKYCQFAWCNLATLHRTTKWQTMTANDTLLPNG